MGKHIWEGWQTSVENAPQPTSILFGANFRKSLSKESQETKQKPQPEDLESDIRSLENSLFQQMAQVQQPMQPELPQAGPTQGEFPSAPQSPKGSGDPVGVRQNQAAQRAAKVPAKPTNRWT